MLDFVVERYDAALQPHTPEETERGLQAHLERVASIDGRRRRVVRWSLVGVGVAAAAFALVSLRSSPHPSGPTLPSLTYRLDGGSVVEGGYLRESGGAGMTVRFNEGSTCALEPGTRGQIHSVGPGGARLGIERGTAAFQFTRTPGRRWLVEAGPFEVTVTGTVFSVSWDPLGERFELRLRHGGVVVRGPLSAGEMALRTGQKLVVNLAKAESVISELETESAGGESVTPQLPPRGETAALPRLAPAPAASPRGAGEPRWREAMARGHWDRVLVEAKSMGIDNVLGRVSSDDLFALADAARYRRQPDLARAALLAERRRFPNSPRALDTLFLLGRVEESRAQGAAQALAWYDDYLTRAPNGPYAGEALGRKMTLSEGVQGAARARRVAEEYLRRFPEGNYAGAARTLLRAP